MKKYFLIDTENVHMKGLKGIETLASDDTVVIFLTNECHSDATKINKFAHFRYNDKAKEWE